MNIYSFFVIFYLNKDIYIKNFVKIYKLYKMLHKIFAKISTVSKGFLH